MNALDCIMNRHSYRGEYFTDIVPSKNDLIKIMEAGLAAPSGCNKQTTSLIAVDDSTIVEKIKNVIDPPIAKTAPAFICVLTQRINAYRDKCYAVQDYSAAIENTSGKSPFDVIDETLYGKEKFKTVKEKIEWVCSNFEKTQKTLDSE